MATHSSALRTCGLLFILIFNCYCEPAELKVSNQICDSKKCVTKIEVSDNTYSLFGVSLRDDCSGLINDYAVEILESEEWSIVLQATTELNNVEYLCTYKNGVWNSLGKIQSPADGVISTANNLPTSVPANDNAAAGEDITELTRVDLTHDIDVNYQDGGSDIDSLLAVSDDFDNSIDGVASDRVGDVDVFGEQKPVSIIRRRRQTEDAPVLTVLSLEQAPMIFKSESVAPVKLGLKPEGIYLIVISNASYPTQGAVCDNGTFVGSEIQVTIGPMPTDALLNIPKEEGIYQLCARTPNGSFASLGPQSLFRVVSDENEVKVEGIRVEEAEHNRVDDGVPSLMENKEAVIRLFGTGFTPNTTIVFTYESTSCQYVIKPEYTPEQNSTNYHTAVYKIVAPPGTEHQQYYICVKGNNGSFVLQGLNRWVMFKTHTTYLPLWASIIFIIICLVFASLFSGLNLGLMSLDRTELKIIAATGTEKEKKYARIIQPVRDHGNFLLCSILFGNVAVINTHTVLLDQLMSGTLAVIMSTLSVVLLSEIIPQAICSRHGLAIGAYTIGVMKAVMGVTAPLAYPVSKLLDYMLGEEIGNVYNRERLKELVKVTNDVNDLDKEEVNIISGALELRKKKVFEVMTKIEDVYMLSIDDVLDFETMSDIVKSGYSRIPVYEAARSNIVTVLFVKDLALIDPDDNTPVRRLCQVYQNPCNFVFEDVTLDIMFKQFKEGHKGHMAFVHRVNNEGEGDPYYETIGLVTLEDVIEELIQAEIVDETDVFMDNRSKRRRNQPKKLHDFAAFSEKRENQARSKISNHLTMATFQYLSTTVDAFRKEIVSENVLKRILQQDIYHQLKVKSKTDEQNCIYTLGKPADYFVLILEGRVEVTVGREGLVFEAGPFTYFGVQALTQNVGGLDSTLPPSTPATVGSLQNLNMDSMLRHTFVPDYSVRATCDTLYIVIKRSMYLAAKRATILETTARNKDGGGEGTQLDDMEVDKLLQEIEDEDTANEKQQSPPQSLNSSLIKRADELNKLIDKPS